MYITNKHISRRTILRGMGAAVSLPLLEAMVPARSAFGKPTADPARLVGIEMVHGSAGSTKYGIEKNLWAPAAEGSAFDLTPSSLSPLEPFRDYLTIVSNTDVRNAEAFTLPEIGGDHFRSSAVFLTQSHPKQTEGSDVHVGTSMDQLYARRFRSRHAHSVDAARDREREPGGRMPIRLCLYLHGRDQLGVADRSAPMIRNPRGRFRPDVRLRRNAGRAGSQAPDRSQHS